MMIPGAFFVFLAEIGDLGVLIRGFFGFDVDI
jgi:hypothetical protein